MREHPNIFVPEQKEIDFFSWHYDRGPEWCRSFFSSRTDEKEAGEISPSYMQ
jgi:hypothetical protein